MKRSIAYAPASISNLNCGFDVLGMAISGLGDEVEIVDNETNENIIAEIENGDGLSKDLDKNTAGIVVKKMLHDLNYFGHVTIRIKKGYSFGSGLGSSAASACAAAVACNHFLGDPYSIDQVLKYAMEGEFVASKSLHGDNVFPAVLGGAVLVKSVEPITHVQLPIPESLNIIIIFPQIEVKTSEARGLLEEKVPLKTAVKQWANLGGLISSFYRSDFDLMEKSMVDEIIEPQRAHLIPGFYELKDLALKNGAVSFGISGSGPSMFAFADGDLSAESILQVLQKRASSMYEDFTIDIYKPDLKGTRIISEE